RFRTRHRCEVGGVLAILSDLFSVCAPSVSGQVLRVTRICGTDPEGLSNHRNVRYAAFHPSIASNASYDSSTDSSARCGIRALILPPTYVPEDIHRNSEPSNRIFSRNGV